MTFDKFLKSSIEALSEVDDITARDAAMLRTLQEAVGSISDDQAEGYIDDLTSEWIGEMEVVKFDPISLPVQELTDSNIKLAGIEKKSAITDYETFQKFRKQFLEIHTLVEKAAIRMVQALMEIQYKQADMEDRKSRIVRTLKSNLSRLLIRFRVSYEDDPEVAARDFSGNYGSMIDDLQIAAVGLGKTKRISDAVDEQAQKVDSFIDNDLGDYTNTRIKFVYQHVPKEFRQALIERLAMIQS